MPDLEDQLRRYGRALDDQLAAEGDPLGSLGERRRRRVGWLARVAAVLAALGMLGASVAVLVGGNDDDRVATDPEVDGVLTAADLIGRTFTVVAMELDGAPQPLAAQPPSLVFGDSTLELRTGCNGSSGDFHVVDGELLFLARGGVDLKACAGAVGEQEFALFDLLEDTRTQPAEARRHPDARLTGDVLELRLRDRAAWAVDVTEQTGIGAQPGDELTAPIADLLGLLARGETEEAIARWQGSFNTCAPTSSDTSSCVPGDEPTARAGIERLLREHPGVTARGPFPAVSYGATPSPGFLAAAVTALSEPDADGARDAAAFVTFAGPPAALTGLPDERGRLAPSSGSSVSAGDRISYDSAPPVVDGAVAHVNGVEVPVEVDIEAGTTSFRVPAWARGEIVVTLAHSTDQGRPVASAAWYRVG